MKPVARGSNFCKHFKNALYIKSPVEFEYTGCLIKNASTHNFFICYPISMNKKTKDMVFHALRSSHKIFFFGVIFNG
jgi:hypothetical protein